MHRPVIEPDMLVAMQLAHNEPPPGCKMAAVAVGNGQVTDNGVRALDVKVGDQVMFGKYAGTEIKVDGEELLVMKEEDIVAVVEK